MRELVNWKDHVVQYPGRFEEQVLGGGLVQHTPSPGKVEQQGTPQNATNLNTMDECTWRDSPGSRRRRAYP